jgi:hypothetical protein
MDDLSDCQPAHIVEQLSGDGFEWGLSSEVNVLSPDKPCIFAEAMASPDPPKWLATCNEELALIRELNVFKLVPKSTADGHSLMNGKFVFKVKCNEEGCAVCWKVRYVVKGYSAIYGVDYTSGYPNSPTISSNIMV